MPPTGFHGLLGLVLASYIPSEKKYARIALFSGSLFPDTDIFGSILVFLVGIGQGLTPAQLEGPVINFHRSVTHNIFLVIILGALGISLITVGKRQTSGVVIATFSFGILLHILFDFLYFDGVSVFWPLQTERVFLPLGLPKILEMPENLQRLLAALDVAFDGIYWILVARLINPSGPGFTFKFRSIMINDLKKKLRLGGATVVLIISLFGLIGYFSDILSRNTFVLILYIPGIVVLFISCALPFLVADVVAGVQKLPGAWFGSEVNR